jgi:lipopolysaccharide transport system ATP-binding protein
VTVEAIVVEGVGKSFRRYHPERPRSIPEAVLKGLGRLGARERYWGLRGVSFRVAPGCMLGVIGRNGAGKSTLLRLIGGVGQPDEGRITVRGRISGLLHLGIGFHTDLTGRENVVVGGVIGGLTRREVAERFDAIVEFAELREFIDSPLRTYSSGMQMRLAFAVAIHTVPDILLIDEVLAVGDYAFQRKCLDRIGRLRAQGRTIVLVSHDTEQVRDLCDEVLWLKDGRTAAFGPADQVVARYLSDLGEETKRRTPSHWPVLRTASGVELRVHENRFGSLDLEIRAVRLLDAQRRLVAELTRADPLVVELEYQAPQPVPNPIFGITISDGEGRTCFETTSQKERIAHLTAHGPGRLIVDIPAVDLPEGSYFVDVWACEQTWAYSYDYHYHGHPLRIRSCPGPEPGAPDRSPAPPRWDWEEVREVVVP